MNKAPWIALTAALLLPLNTGVAMVNGVTPTGLQLIGCEGGRCDGTDNADIIVASNKAERVVAGAGNDPIELDLAFLMGQGDVGEGGEGQDCIDGGGVPDLMLGGPGDDTLIGGEGDEEDVMMAVTAATCASAIQATG